MATGQQSDYLLGNANNDGKRSFSLIQCLGFALVIGALVGFFSNLDRIIDGDDDSSGNSPSPALPASVVAVVTDNADLSTLASALTSAGLIETLSGAGPFTVFGPTNEAFNAITLPTNESVVSSILTYHVVSGDIKAADLTSGLVATTLQGETITCYLDNGGVFFYDSKGGLAQVTDADNSAQNGVVHTINRVLIPGGVVNDSIANIAMLSSLDGALVANGLDIVLAGEGAFTVFAPNNEAVSDFTGTIDSDLLTYHVIPSKILSTDLVDGVTVEVVTVNGATLKVTRDGDAVLIEDALGRDAEVTVANIASTNGVVHIIDEVLAPIEYRTIVDLAVATDDLSTLVTALTTADLVDTLSGPGPFTVLAPTNEAFAAIVVPSNVTDLTNVLLYHVINGAIVSGDLSDGLVAPTVLGGQNTVTANLVGGVGFFDSMGGKSLVITADIVASNGVIHIVDAVLIPSGTVNDVTSNVETLSSLDGALVANGLNTTLAGPGNYTLFAPSNDAVTAFVAENGVIDSELLLYHVLPARYLSADIPDGETVLPSANTAGTELTVINNGSGIFVRDVNGRVGAVTTANLNTMNGVVHIIDIVLDNVNATNITIPNIVEIAVATPDLSTLVSALTTADLVDTLSGPGPFTVLAPTNEAFAAIDVPSNVTDLTNVLLYHVINGAIVSGDLTDGLVAPTVLGGQNTVTANLVGGVGFYDSMGGKSLVITADIVASNGIIHIVDAVLIPGGTVSNVTGNVDTLSSLDGALVANNLKATLAGPGNFTLFAPSNDAVAAFNGVIDSDLLVYHVLADRFLSADIPEGETVLPTLNTAADVTVINNGSGVFVRDVTGRVGQVTTANLNTMNGVVHIIDIVLDDTATTTTTA